MMGYLEELLPDWLIKILAPAVGDLTKDMGEYGEEIEVCAADISCFPQQCVYSCHPCVTQGLYNALKPYAPADGGVFSLGTVVGMNLVYSFSAACTSIVAQNSNGRCSDSARRGAAVLTSPAFRHHLPRAQLGTHVDACEGGLIRRC